ncbi:uncharacterized protein HKW66_Vig0156790 [Vigna angularis]|uniref:Uncharacterized protein n=1 Tax=Phaseolus angularis TaxID=3914 RepID=A0A8T0JLW8_PHAAN|nr:uncharacterized protein HKW66_Vig0156790 [Vigna angularis]
MERWEPHDEACYLSLTFSSSKLVNIYDIQSGLRYRGTSEDKEVPATELNDVAVKIVGSEVHGVPKSSSALFFGVIHLGVFRRHLASILEIQKKRGKERIYFAIKEPSFVIGSGYVGSNYVTPTCF